MEKVNSSSFMRNILHNLNLAGLKFLYPMDKFSMSWHKYLKYFQVNEVVDNQKIELITLVLVESKELCI